MARNRMRIHESSFWNSQRQVEDLGPKSFATPRIRGLSFAVAARSRSQGRLVGSFALAWNFRTDWSRMRRNPAERRNARKSYPFPQVVVFETTTLQENRFAD